MPKIRILRDYSPSEGWQPGDVVDATFDVTQLLAEGKVEIVDENTNPEPVAVEVTEADVVAEEVTTPVEETETTETEPETTEETEEVSAEVEG